MNKGQGFAMALIVTLGAMTGFFMVHSPSADSNEKAETTQVKTPEQKPSTMLLPVTASQMKDAGIQTEKVTGAVMGQSITFPGEITLDQSRTAHVLPLASGFVKEVRVQPGSAVKQGDVLAVISSQEVSDLQAEAAASERRLELAEANYQREKTLWEEQISAKQDYLVARQKWQEAQIVLKNARQKLRAFGDGAAAGGSRYELRAPFDGMVVGQNLALGENVSGLNTGALSSGQTNQTTSAFTISDLSQVWANFSITSHDLKRVQVGKDVKVISPDLQMEVTGKVTLVGSLLGNQTRTAQARVTLENPDGIWRPGLFVTVQVETDSHQSAVTVPEQAIQNINDEPVVFRRVEKGFELTPVSLGEHSHGRIEITAGLPAGSEVASEGSFVLKSMADNALAEE